MVTIFLPRDLKKDHNAGKIEALLTANPDVNLRKIRKIVDPRIGEAKGKVIDHETGKEYPADPIFIHPDLRKKDGSQVTAADIPDDMSFGNGVTSLGAMRLKDGSRVPAVIIVLESGVAVNAGRLTALKSLLDVMK